MLLCYYKLFFPFDSSYHFPLNNTPLSCMFRLVIPFPLSHNFLVSQVRYSWTVSITALWWHSKCRCDPGTLNSPLIGTKNFKGAIVLLESAILESRLNLRHLQSAHIFRKIFRILLVHILSHKKPIGHFYLLFLDAFHRYLFLLKVLEEWKCWKRCCKRSTSWIICRVLCICLSVSPSSRAHFAIFFSPPLFCTIPV